MNRRSIRLMAVLSTSTALVVAGCATNTEGRTTTAPSVAVSADAGLSEMVPDDIRDKGVLTVGVDATYAPMEFKDSAGKIVGFDVDLMDAAAHRLGLDTEWTESTFDNIIPGVTGGKYDVGASSFTDTVERQSAVDFVNYLYAGTQWAARTGTTVDPDNACGVRVAVQTGSIQETDDLPARSKECEAAGREPIEILKFDKQEDGTSAVVLGQADAFLADSTLTAYAVKQSDGELELAGDIYGEALLGWPFAKDSDVLPALQAALQSLIDDGTYEQIAARWGIESGLVEEATRNGATQ